MSPHDFRRLALAHELLASAPTGDVPAEAHAEPELAGKPRARTPAIDDPRDADG
ncbi:MAG: hypothetical protein ACREF1_09155 [Acetobacteraceae bacterium]